jgi:hypothetical protein
MVKPVSRTMAKATVGIGMKATNGLVEAALGFLPDCQTTGRAMTAALMVIVVGAVTLAAARSMSRRQSDGCGGDGEGAHREALCKRPPVMPKTKRCIIGDAAPQMTQASLDQKLVLRGNALFLFSNAEEPVLVFVMLTDSLPSGLRVLVTFFLLPSASALNLENDSLPSALWVLVTLCLLPSASLVNLEIDSLPSELRLLVKLVVLPNSSVLDVVVRTDCAEAVSAHAREIARVAARTAARAFMTALLSIVALPRKRSNHLTLQSCNM